jgi:HlyD family secretion protein
MLLPCSLLTACSSKAARTPATPARDPPPRTVRVTEGRLQPSVTLSGIIAPFQNVTISSSLQEPADAVYVNEGDAVRAGQLLAQLDTADLEANYNAALRNADDAYLRVAQTRDQGTLNIQQGNSAYASAESQLAQAQQKLNLSQVTLQRDRALYAQGFLSHQVLDNDTTEYESDRQAVTSAKANLENAAATVRVNGNDASGLQQENVASARAGAASAKAQAQQIAVQISKASIRSPVDGVVINRNLNPGQYPGNASIFTVQQINTVYAMLNASSDQVFLIRPGTPADVSVGSLRTNTMHGIVEAVLGQAQPGGTNFMVKVRIANPSGALKSGMVVAARIRLPAIAGTMIPTGAFIDAAHDAVRMQQRDGTIGVVTVRDLAEDGAHSIVDGLPANARIVVQE